MTIITLILSGINLVALGILLYRLSRLVAVSKPVSVEPAKPIVELTPVDMAELEKEKIRLVAETEAFRQLMNYNAGVAYGTSQRRE